MRQRNPSIWYPLVNSTSASAHSYINIVHIQQFNRENNSHCFQTWKMFPFLLENSWEREIVWNYHFFATAFFYTYLHDILFFARRKLLTIGVEGEEARNGAFIGEGRRKKGETEEAVEEEVENGYLDVARKHHAQSITSQNTFRTISFARRRDKPWLLFTRNLRTSSIWKYYRPPITPLPRHHSVFQRFYAFESRSVHEKQTIRLKIVTSKWGKLKLCHRCCGEPEVNSWL